MKKYAYATGTFVLALAMSGLPAVVLADNDRGDDDVRAEVRMQAQEQESRSEATRSDEQKNDEEMRSEDQDEQEIELELEDDEDLASSFDDLRQRIETRKHELDDEEASTTPEFKEVMKNANPVRLAVHSLLASKELLGGIGEQVSAIAREMNRTIATTTSAEAKIHSRGFFARLFFGGDRAAAEAISQVVAQNQQRAQQLVDLIGQGNAPAEVKEALEAQLEVLKDAQARLEELAQKERGAWGLFSWRL
ncbi:MAG: hypothetical protein G01um101449_476 [Parcubacteria group bacterium Gr01-1014_49]|nr:MAG: hypothetical protein G01um101449_476 [Parcubacteria group bacterium Gr01-1014_49]